VILAGQGTLREFPAVNYCSVHIFSSGKKLSVLVLKTRFLEVFHILDVLGVSYDLLIIQVTGCQWTIMKVFLRVHRLSDDIMILLDSKAS
jgi:hypothetical protein